MIEYITICVLCWTGAGTIFYFAVKAEEFIMKRLTGEGAIESAYRILKGILKKE
ncbi:MAG: hypothetical protein HDQ97_09140 [Lachnospiraceae bacterium]|nr:hypothetical protein [Lachnospiraceae bacterium]